MRGHTHSLLVEEWSPATRSGNHWLCSSKIALW
jgi:hypothetical protein